MSHHLEGGAKEALTDLRRAGARAAADARAPHDARPGMGIKLVPEEHADERPDGAAGQQAEQSADRFSDPLHTLIY